MFCPNCGIKLPGDSDFCQYCGASVKTHTQNEIKTPTENPADSSTDVQKTVEISGYASPSNRPAMKKKNKANLLIIILSLLCVLAVVAACIGFISASNAKSNLATAQLEVDSAKNAQKELQEELASIQKEHDTLLEEFDTLSDDYSWLLAKYTVINDSYDQAFDSQFYLTVGGGIVYPDMDSIYFHTPTCELFKDGFTGDINLFIAHDLDYLGYSPCNKCHSSYEIELYEGLITDSLSSINNNTDISAPSPILPEAPSSNFINYSLFGVTYEVPNCGQYLGLVLCNQYTSGTSAYFHYDLSASGNSIDEVLNEYGAILIANGFNFSHEMGGTYVYKNTAYSVLIGVASGSADKPFQVCIMPN
jgi:hypothetical protein